MMPFLKYMAGGLRCFTAYLWGSPQLDCSQGAEENAEGAEFIRLWRSPPQISRRNDQPGSLSIEETASSRLCRLGFSFSGVLTLKRGTPVAPSLSKERIEFLARDYHRGFIKHCGLEAVRIRGGIIRIPRSDRRTPPNTGQFYPCRSHGYYGRPHRRLCSLYDGFLRVPNTDH
jgi:hypothetical protein